MKLNTKKVGKYSKDTTTRYLEVVRSDNPLEGGIDVNVFERLLPLLPTYVNGKTVLDIGCGDGWWDAMCVQKGARALLGIDNSEDMISVAKDRHAQENVNFRVEDLTTFQASQPFEVLLSIFSVMYFQDIAQTIQHASKNLLAGGHFILVTNIFSADSPEIEAKVIDTPIQLVLGYEKKVLLENYFHTLAKYQQGFAKAGLETLVCEKFESMGVVIADEAPHKENISLHKYLFVLQK